MSRAAFLRCDAPGAAEDAALAAAFAAGGWERVQSFRLDDRLGQGTWYRGNGWALSADPAPMG